MKGSERLDYKAAGVDIDLADEFIRRIGPVAASTRTDLSMDAIGSFAGMIRLDGNRWREPVLVACTDGVGTKLKLAFETGDHSGIGIDLVAMSVNDLLVTGATPVAFLDYLATSRLELENHTAVIESIAEGCRQSGCALVGGETAELPGFYSAREYDLAGFALGVVEKSEILSPDNVIAGDWIIGIPSDGIHSNGYSLVRKIFEDRNRFPLDQPLRGMKEPLGRVLLKPTRIYRPELAAALAAGGLKSAAHITGGGIPGNLPRAIPKHLGICLVEHSWPVPEIFRQMQDIGEIEDQEMYRTFNMGLGMMLVVSPDRAHALIQSLEGGGYSAHVVGWIDAEPGLRRVKKFDPPTPVTGKCGSIGTRKSTAIPRIAVLGSGRGSNMESLCEAIDRDDLHASIACVISNNSKAFILERARCRGIPAVHLSGKTHPGNESSALQDVLKHYRIDAIVLAGYMKKLSPEIVEEYRDRIFNIHPALLPAFGGPGMYGMNVHRAVLRSGAVFSGVTVHRVDEDYDTGYIVAQRVVQVLPGDSPEMLAARVLKQEHDLYWRVLEKALHPGSA
ncbi:MAG TPA: phosphoribosylformylglycinamidine cyclo-ligase [bacterium]|nr:phosphoribosylformylglycinamidine cyclo-ligase [bacterium]